MSMRKLTIVLARSEADLRHAQENGYEAARNLDEVLQLAPWAADVMEVDGAAWIAFESSEDARRWQEQA